MADRLPPEVRVRRFADGVAYDLPRRPLGGLRVAGVFLVVFGAVFAAVPVTVAATRLASGTPGPFELVFAAFSLTFLLAGGSVSAIGLAMLRGRASIVVRPNRLVAIEQLGPLRWRRRRNAGGLCRIEVQRGAARVNGRPVTEGPMAAMAAMKAEFTKGKPFILALGYPQQWLTAVAEHIKADLPTLCPATLFEDDDEAAAVEVVTTTAADPEPDEPAGRPAGTSVTVDDNPDGLTITIPPAGLWKGSKGLFAFSIVWCGFMTVFTAATVLGPLMHGKFDDNGWVFAAFCAAFWAIGIGMMLGAINMGRRHAILDVVDDVLLINRRNLFGIRSHQWTRDQLKTVTVGPSGMEVNDVPVLELKVRPVEGKDVGMFAGREVDELRWIASVVRQGLWSDKAAA